MFINILVAIIIAKIKSYKIRPLLKAYPLYPFYFAELIYIALQVCIFFDIYTFVEYAKLINSLYMYTLIIPVLYYRLYKPGMIGSLLIVLGTLLNKFVMSQNGGKMPVYPTLSKLTGYFNEAAIQSADNIHVLGNESVKFKFLTDYIDIGTSILSIGDVLIHSFITIIIYYTIKELNLSNNSREKELLKYGYIKDNNI